MPSLSRSPSGRSRRHSAVHLAWQVSQKAQTAREAAERAASAAAEMTSLAGGLEELRAYVNVVTAAAAASDRAAVVAEEAAEDALSRIEATHHPMFADELGITILHPHTDDLSVGDEVAEDYGRASRAHRDATEASELAEEVVTRIRELLHVEP